MELQVEETKAVKISFTLPPTYLRELENAIKDRGEVEAVKLLRFMLPMINLKESREIVQFIKSTL